MFQKRKLGPVPITQSGFVPIPVLAYMLVTVIAVVSGYVGYKLGNGNLWILSIVFGGGIIIGYKLKNFIIDMLQSMIKQVK